MLHICIASIVHFPAGSYASLGQGMDLDVLEDSARTVSSSRRKEELVRKREEAAEEEQAAAVKVSCGQ